MRRDRFLTGAALLCVAAPASADTLRDAMVEAYRTSPVLSGAQANLRATDENVPIARAGGLPTLSSTGGVTQDIYDSSRNDSLSVSPERRATAGLDLSVPVFQGGAVRNSVRAAETRVEAGRADLRRTESDLFTDVVSAYLNVIRDQAIVQLNQQNVRVLDVNLRATRDRFEVGDLTRTDVAQSEARRSLALSQLQAAEAQLISSRENYIRVVGSPPEALAPPPPLPNLPETPSGAVAVALQENPQLEAAERARAASGYDVDVARAGRLPKVSVVLGSSYYNYLGTASAPVGLGSVGIDNDGIANSVGVQLSLPLFQGGRPAAQIRQAQARQTAAAETVTATERAVIAQARSSYALWQSALRAIQSYEVAVSANRLSLEGVQAENTVGTRTILDILNAQQELLNSQVQLVSARRDAYVAGFTLLAAMGRAEAEDLGLDGGPLYDPIANYEAVRGSISDWNTGRETEPVGTSTRETPVQSPDVSGLPPLESGVQGPVDSGY